MFAQSRWCAWTRALRALFHSEKTLRQPRDLRLEHLEARDVPTAGLLDPTFGNAGKTVVPFDLGGPGNVTDQAHAFTVQQDNKIVIVGSAQDADGESDFAVTRLNADGSLDTSFNGTGKQTIRFQTGGEEIASGVALQADGKIVVVGYVQVTGTAAIPINPFYEFGAARLNADGSLDTTFGSKLPGRAVYAFTPLSLTGGAAKPIDAFAEGVALQGDGKIVVVGYAKLPSSVTDIAAMRFNADGSLDTTFGTQAQTVMPVLKGVTTSVANAVAVETDGSLVLVGYGIEDTGHAGIAYVHLDANGRLTAPAGTPTIVASLNTYGATDEYANAVTVQPDGNILVAGEATVSPTVTDFLVVRYTPKGGTDQTFNGQGYNIVTISGGADFANGLALQPDGKILVGGQVQTSANSSGFGVLRLNSNGTVDTTFNGTGHAVYGFNLVPNNQDYAAGVALQSDGGIILAGTVDNAGTANQDFGALRLTGDGTNNGGNNGGNKLLNFDKLGAYRPSNGSFSLDTNGNRVYDPGVDAVYTNYAPAGAIPVAGNWNDSPDGRDKIGYFLNGTWHLDVNGDGIDDAGDLTFKFGDAGDTPVVGKWDGVHTEVGIFTTRGTFTGFIIDANGSHDLSQGESHVFGLPGDKVVVGDWTGDGKTKIGVFRANPDGSGSALFSLDLVGDYTYHGYYEAFVYGLATDGFVVGDWNGSGTSKLGVYRSSPVHPGVAYFTLDTNGDRQYEAGTDEVFEFGLASDQYIAGNWAPPPGTPKAAAAQDAAFTTDLTTLPMM